MVDNTGDLSDSWDDAEPIDRETDQAARDVEFSMFYGKEMPQLITFLIIRDLSVAVAADVAQEAMLETYRHWNTIDKPRAYVRTVATRASWPTVNTERKERPHDQVPEPSRLLTDEVADEIEARHTFLKLIRGLTPAQREVMAWTYDGYRPTEIAAVLGKPPATVRSLLRDAREALRPQRPSVEETP